MSCSSTGISDDDLCQRKHKYVNGALLRSGNTDSSACHLKMNRVHGTCRSSSTVKECTVPCQSSTAIAIFSYRCHTQVQGKTFTTLEGTDALRGYYARQQRPLHAWQVALTAACAIMPIRNARIRCLQRLSQGFSSSPWKAWVCQSNKRVDLGPLQVREALLGWVCKACTSYLSAA